MMRCHRGVFAALACGRVAVALTGLMLATAVGLAAAPISGRAAAPANNDLKYENWTTVKPPNGGFSVRMPGEPTHSYNAQPLDNSLIVADFYTLRGEAGEVVYTAMAYDLSEVPAKLRDVSRLSKLLPRDYPPSTNPLKSKDVEISGLPGVTRSGAVNNRRRVLDKAVLDGTYFYRVRVDCAPEHVGDPEVAYFFKSFKLLKKK